MFICSSRFPLYNSPLLYVELEVYLFVYPSRIFTHVYELFYYSFNFIFVILFALHSHKANYPLIPLLFCIALILLIISLSFSLLSLRLIYVHKILFKYILPLMTKDINMLKNISSSKKLLSFLNK